MSTMGGEETKSPTSLALSVPDATSIDHSDSTHPEKPTPAITDDEYPHGTKLVILAASAMAAVFLIALDQVSAHSPSANDMKQD